MAPECLHRTQLSESILRNKFLDSRGKLDISGNLTAQMSEQPKDRPLSNKN